MNDNIHQDNRQLEHQQRQATRKEKVVITKSTEQNLNIPQMVHNHNVQTDEWQTIGRRGKPINKTTVEESSNIPKNDATTRESDSGTDGTQML